jgi:hypothetical protein
MQDLIEIVLAEQGYAPIVAAYKRFRKHRQLARERIRVRNSQHTSRGRRQAGGSDGREHVAGGIGGARQHAAVGPQGADRYAGCGTRT